MKTITRKITIKKEELGEFKNYIMNYEKINFPNPFKNLIKHGYTEKEASKLIDEITIIQIKMEQKMQEDDLKYIKEHKSEMI